MVRPLQDLPRRRRPPQPRRHPDRAAAGNPDAAQKAAVTFTYADLVKTVIAVVLVVALFHGWG